MYDATHPAISRLVVLVLVVLGVEVVVVALVAVTSTIAVAISNLVNVMEINYVKRKLVIYIWLANGNFIPVLYFLQNTLSRPSAPSRWH